MSGLTDRKLCEGCVYWHGASGSDNAYVMCHHLLNTGKRRVVEDGVCKSKKTKRGKKRKYNPFMMEI